MAIFSRILWICFDRASLAAAETVLTGDGDARSLASPSEAPRGTYAHNGHVSRVCEHRWLAIVVGVRQTRACKCRYLCSSRHRPHFDASDAFETSRVPLDALDPLDRLDRVFAGGCGDGVLG